MEVTALTDRPTIFDAANHSDRTHDGGESRAGHELSVAADAFPPLDQDFCPVGEVRPVDGTGYDFRVPRVIAPHAPGIDVGLVIGPARRPVTEVPRLRGRFGLTMRAARSEPGIQIYDGRDALRPGRAVFEGFAVEAQGWPDAPNHDGFAPVDLMPDAPYRQTTE